MNKTFLTYAALLVIFIFIGFMIYDSVKPEGSRDALPRRPELLPKPDDMWEIAEDLPVKQGKLKAVAVSEDGFVYAAGDSFISCYDNELNEMWNLKTADPVTSIVCSGDTLFASTIEVVLVVSRQGKLLTEWGPFDQNCIITSVSANHSNVAFCDAGNKKVYILDKGGEVVAMAGQNDPQFILPSAYFDIVLNEDNSFFVSNPGHRRVEKRNTSGEMESYFGEAGLAPEAFCGCCNPSHFTKISNGFITAEKGLNRIKILDNNGDFVEFVSSDNDFEPAVPLDIASVDGSIIYAANPADSKLYVFRRK